MDIETQRLVLRLVPLAGLAATAAKDRAACHRLIGEKLPDEWFEDSWVADMRLKQWQEDPGYAPWSVRAIAVRETGEIVGNINCHDRPLPFKHKGEAGLMIEMGYTIFADYRLRGFGYEAADGLARFAAGRGVRWVRLAIAPGNDPSLRLAAKLGAEKIGSQIDEIDGPEDVYLFGI